jgi:glycerophosphoryl diester phosphodiesterase
MALARILGLKVHPWYIRDDFLTVGANAYEENRKFYEVGLDGVFTEYPHTTYQLFLEWSKQDQREKFENKFIY